MRAAGPIGRGGRRTVEAPRDGRMARSASRACPALFYNPGSQSERSDDRRPMRDTTTGTTLGTKMESWMPSTR